MFYIGGVMLLAASLSLPPFFMVLSQAILIVNWIFEEKFKTRMQMIWGRKSLVLFLSIFLIHIIWLIPTRDFSFALNDLKIKLPLLILPLVLATSRRLRENEIKFILLSFCGGLIIHSFFSISRLTTITTVPMADFRDLSVFISHIRLSLLISLAIFSLFYLLITRTFQWQRILRNCLWVSLTWLVIYLLVLQSVTGIIVFIITGIFFILRFYNKIEQQYWYIKYPFVYGIAAAVLLVFAYSFVVMLSFSGKPPDEIYLKSHTEMGNPYIHDLNELQMENGNFIWINICEDELRHEWNRRSSIDFNGYDMNGHDIRYTLIRYLTSRGLDKDAVGVHQLSETDIINIERGMSNYIYQHNKWIYPRIYQIIWEIDNYRKGGNPSGHSVAQRFEYWKSAMDIIKDNILLGVGTGDVGLAWENHYAGSPSSLAPEWQLRAHNQFLTFLITFGITGFIIIISAIIAPFFMEKRHWDILPFVFIVIAILSMLTEDTLETQAGATFFAFFYSLFIFAHQKNEVNEVDGEGE